MRAGVPRKPTPAALEATFRTHGPLSEEFYHQVYGLVLFVLRRYVGQFDEDSISEAMVRLYESFSYYDPSRINVASWVYTVVRNKASSRKVDTKTDSIEEVDELPEQRQDWGHDIMDADKTLLSLKHVSLSFNMRSQVITEDDSLIDHPLRRMLAWRTVNC